MPLRTLFSCIGRTIILLQSSWVASAHERRDDFCILAITECINYITYQLFYNKEKTTYFEVWNMRLYENTLYTAEMELAYLELDVL